MRSLSLLFILEKGRNDNNMKLRTGPKKPRNRRAQNLNKRSPMLLVELRPETRHFSSASQSLMCVCEGSIAEQEYTGGRGMAVTQDEP